MIGSILVQTQEKMNVSAQIDQIILPLPGPQGLPVPTSIGEIKSSFFSLPTMYYVTMQGHPDLNLNKIFISVFCLFLYRNLHCTHSVPVAILRVVKIYPSVQLISRVWLFVTPWIAAHQASLSITKTRSSLRLTSIKLVMPSSHLILCRPLLLLPPIPPSIRVFSNESTLRMRWPKY